MRIFPHLITNQENTTMTEGNRPLLNAGERVLSIDVFRGLTILLMIFVNDMAGVRDLPFWLKHMPKTVDGMTFVDVVFPAFLFIVGMSIPFAFEKRLKSGQTLWQLWQHILIRTIGLLIVGFFMVNLEETAGPIMIIPRNLWSLLFYISIILVWNVYPKVTDGKKTLYHSLRYLGIVMLIILAVIYRRNEEGTIGWMKTSWWGILGMIGWAYLVGCAVYFVFKRHLAGIVGMVGILSILYIGFDKGVLWFFPLKEFLMADITLCSHGSITVAGLVLGMIFSNQFGIDTPKKKIVWTLIFGLFMAIAAYCLRPLYGIGKIPATPSWCLYCNAICCVIFVFLYWLIDLKKKTGWTNFLKPAGANPLLAYILPDIVAAIFGLIGISYFYDLFGFGVVGIVRAFVFALIMVWVTGLLSKINIRLHL